MTNYPQNSKIYVPRKFVRIWYIAVHFRLPETPALEVELSESTTTLTAAGNCQSTLFKKVHMKFQLTVLPLLSRGIFFNHFLSSLCSY